MSQQLAFWNEQDLPAPRWYPLAFRANLTALWANVKHLVTSVTSGRSSGVCFARLDHDGSWVKMYGGYCQANLDGSLEEYCEIWPPWGTVLDGACTELIGLEPFIKESGFLSLPTPLAGDGLGWKRLSKTDVQHSIHRQWKRGGTIHCTYYMIWDEISPVQATEYVETMMGFPSGWTILPH